MNFFRRTWVGRIRHRFAGVCLIAGLFLLSPQEAWAGMPSPHLTDWGRMRVETISFFGFLFLTGTAGVRLLWNSLASEFTWMPRLSYRQTLAAVLIWGLAMVVVLTMIAGSRELLTPGAWEKDGLLYKVASTPSPDPPTTNRSQARQDKLERLKAMLWDYVAAHDGQFPDSDCVPEIPAECWEVPEGGGLHYVYVPNLAPAGTSAVLAYEPGLFGDERLVLQTNGQVVALTSAELWRRLEGKK